MSKEIISTNKAPQAIGPYSQAVKTGNLIFISGQLTKSSVLSEIQNYWFLLLAVLIGGQIGNF